MGSMNELALFTGAGGGLLGSRLLGWRTVCGVEIDPYCREVLLRRQADGMLDLFPIWDDIRTFDGRPWRGLVDVVTAGFPCQPFSSAARGRHVEAPLWPATAETIREVRPASVLLENVANSKSYMRLVRHDLRVMGYCVRPLASIAAASVGALHIRRRWWLLADSHCKGQPRLPVYAEVAKLQELRSSVWGSDPGKLGMVNGVASRVDRLRAIGNGQVPAVVRAAWELLKGTD
jgi:DNA (cytosine-5)-methyltransferase 1